MPWHLSKSDPRKVYDERHAAVCVCQTPEQAALIVLAVTALPALQLQRPDVIQLREPARVGIPEPMDTFEPDDTCCGKAISKAARTGVLKSLQAWECPGCGCAWNPQVSGNVRHWVPAPAAILFGGR